MLLPWGSGPEPAEHEFMQRLFKSWDVDGTAALSLQNVVTGFAKVKGPRDIMSNISYFFELYDDDKDGKVDREGILRISEALLFLSRRGISGGLSSSSSSANLADFGPDGQPARRENKDEQFLGSISAFIRRCFEYADPDQGAGGKQEEPAKDDDTQTATAALNSFSIGDDDENEDDDDDDDESSKDLLDLGEEKTSEAVEDTPSVASPTVKSPSSLSFGQTTPTSPSHKHASANLALDPNHPLHITLPTFRMLVLADEVLESFFDSGFPNSFHLADAPLPSSTITSSSSNLSTSAGVAALAGSGSGLRHSPLGSPGVGGPGAGVVGPGKGLRGMLDNIVTDGMRVAAEVRRRMDEAQKELDRGGVTRGTNGDDDDDDEEEHDAGGDLLEGAEVDVGISTGAGKSDGPESLNLMDQPEATTPIKSEKAKGKEKLVVAPDPAIEAAAEGDDTNASTVFER